MRLGWTCGELNRGLQVVPSPQHTLLKVVEGEVRGARGKGGQGQERPRGAVPQQRGVSRCSKDPILNNLQSERGLQRAWPGWQWVGSEEVRTRPSLASLTSGYGVCGSCVTRLLGTEEFRCRIPEQGALSEGVQRWQIAALFSFLIHDRCHQHQIQNPSQHSTLGSHWRWHMLWNLFATALLLRVGKLRPTLGKEFTHELTAKSQIHPRSISRGKPKHSRGGVQTKVCREGTGMRQEPSARAPTR